jgi:hypothetical protein
VSGPPVVLNVLPVGGCVMLQFYGAEKGDFAPPSGVVSITLSRAVSGGTFVQLYSGPPLPVWADVGDGPSTSSQPLDPTLSYEWQVTDSTGTTQVGPATPAGAIVTVPDGLTALLIRLLQAACDNAPKPSGVSVQSVQVTTKMPAAGWGAMPFVVLNMDLIQQRDTSVGQDVLIANAQNQWTLPGWSRRVWRASVLSQDADERDFYRDTLLIAWRALKATLFSFVGQNVRHDYQANSGTTGDEWLGQGPGLYWADVMMTLEGSFDVTILTGFGLIEQIDVFSTSAPGVTDEIEVPPSAG